MVIPPFTLVEIKLSPAPLTVVVAVTLPFRSASKLWIRSLVAAFGVTRLVVLVVAMLPPGLLHATVTGSTPEVEQDCASALCGSPISQTVIPQASAMQASLGTAREPSALVAANRDRKRKPQATISRPAAASTFVPRPQGSR